MMTKTCPYHPCQGRNLDSLEPERLVGYCPDCRRMVIRCTAADCLAFNRPFLPYCRECGRRFRQGSRLVVPESVPQGGVCVRHVAVDGNLNRWFSGNGGLDCRMLVAEGLLFVQSSSGWIVGLHPAPEHQIGAQVVFAQRPAGGQTALFPMQLLGTTLVLASRQQIWQLPLVSLWDLNNNFTPDPDDHSLGPRFESVYKAPPQWELACAPAPHDPAGETKPELLVLLRQPNQARIGRYIWVRLRGAVAGEERSLGQITGKHVSCSVLSPTLASVTTERGQWFLARFEYDEMRIRFTLDRTIAIGTHDQKPAAVVLRHELADDARVFAFFVDAEDPDEPRLFYYMAQEPGFDHEVHPMPVRNGCKLWPVAGLRGKDEPSVLSVQGDILYRCDLSGTTSQLASIPGVGQQSQRMIAVEGVLVQLLWKGTLVGQPDTCDFGLLECSSQLTILFQQQFTALRAIPSIWGRYLFVLQDDQHVT